MTTKICSSFSKPMKFPNHDFLASLVGKIESVSKYSDPRKNVHEQKGSALFWQNKNNILASHLSEGLWLTQG